MANEFFISYSRKDKEFVIKLFDRFKQEGIDPWLDVDDLAPAGFWRQELMVAIQHANDFIYCLSPDSCRSGECTKELEHALALEKRIIPIVVQPTPKDLIHPGLREINWLFFEEFEPSFKQLLAILEAPQGFSFGGRLDSKIEINSNGTIKNFFLYRNRYLIGRDFSALDGNDFEGGLIKIKADPYVSRISATLQLVNNRWFLGDGLVKFKNGTPSQFTASRNGNIINGKRQASKTLHPLRHGDEIRLGQHTSMIYLELRPDDEDQIEGDNKETWV